MNIHRLALLGLASLLLGACADRSGCPADLREAGEARARTGARPDLPNARCELSAAERDQYLAGRATGLQWFCAERRLFDEARLGRSPALDNCPLDFADGALAAQRTGEELRKAQDAAAREEALASSLLGTDPHAASEAALRARTAQSELEQLRALAIVRGWMDNPALSGALPDSPDLQPAAPAAGTDPQPQP